MQYCHKHSCDLNKCLICATDRIEHSLAKHIDLINLNSKQTRSSRVTDNLPRYGAKQVGLVVTAFVVVLLISLKLLYPGG